MVDVEVERRVQVQRRQWDMHLGTGADGVAGNLGVAFRLPRHRRRRRVDTQKLVSESPNAIGVFEQSLTKHQYVGALTAGES